MLVHQSGQSALPQARRHANRRPAAGRNVRRSPLPAGHLPPRAPRGLGRLATTTEVFLGNPRIPAGEKKRLAAEHDRASQVVAAIDQAAAKERQ